MRLKYALFCTRREASKTAFARGSAAYLVLTIRYIWVM